MKVTWQDLPLNLGNARQVAAIATAFALPLSTSGQEITLAIFVVLALPTLDRARLNATLRSDNAESARTIADRLNGLLGMARGYLGAANNPKSAPIVDALKAVSITSSNNDVKITGSFPADLLSSLFGSAERKSQ